MPDDRDPDVPASLEPPSLFRRKRRPTPEPAAADPAPAPDAPTEVVEVVEVEAHAPEPEVEATAVIPAPEPEPAPAAPPLFADEVEPATPTPAPKPLKAAKAAKAAKAPKAPRTPRGPLLTGLAAAVAAGLLVGLLVVLLTAGGEQLCEAAQGTSSCGGAGYPLVLAILVVAVIAGGMLLRWSQVPDPGSTSFLAVGLLAVIALLFLVDQLDSWWMLVVIPVVSMATYAASHWVTTAVIEPARE